MGSVLRIIFTHMFSDMFRRTFAILRETVTQRNTSIKLKQSQIYMYMYMYIYIYYKYV